MREIRQSGSEGGARRNTLVPTPIGIAAPLALVTQSPSSVAKCPQPVNRQPLFPKPALEIGERIIRIVRPFDLGESATLGHGFAHLRKVGGVIGLEAQLTPRFETPLHRLQKRRVYQASYV